MVNTPQKTLVLSLTLATFSKVQERCKYGTSDRSVFESEKGKEDDFQPTKKCRTKPFAPIKENSAVSWSAIIGSEFQRGGCLFTQSHADHMIGLQDERHCIIDEGWNVLDTGTCIYYKINSQNTQETFCHNLSALWTSWQIVSMARKRAFNSTKCSFILKCVLITSHKSF